MELGATITERRRQTRSSIYHRIYESRDFCSKQSLAHDLGLSLPTVYQNLTELMDAGLVRYSGEQRSTGGRRAMGLDIVPDARIAVGASITENHLRFVAADLRLQELFYKNVGHETFTHPSNFGPFFARELEVFLDENEIDRARLLGVGVALPAVISPDSTKITLAPTLPLQDFYLDGLTADIPYPVHVENDGTCGGYAEWFMRKDPGSTAYLFLENGVGGSLLINGSLYTGNRRHSAEFGHMCVEPGGLLCKCGRRGCLEAYCSTRRISDELGITLKDFFAGIERRDPEYTALWDDLLHHLAIGINNIHMALDCDVVLGGFLSQHLSDYMPRLQEYVAAANAFSSNADFPHLKLSIFRRHSVPLGAALHYITDFLEMV